MKRTPLTRKTPLRTKSPMKKSRPKTTPIRQSARDEACTMRLPGVCNGDPSTVVWAHSNRQEHGHGMGIKAADQFGAYACSSCHAVLDGHAKRPPWLTLDQVSAAFDRAMAESRSILKAKCLLSEDEAA